jgi:carboxyl-terminal processing protease
MKRLYSCMLLASLLITASPASAADPAQPFAETAEVYRLVLESHLSKPEEKLLVQGALQNVAEQTEQLRKLDLTVPPADDTLPELESRLAEWASVHKLDVKTLNHWAIAGMLETLQDPHTAFFTREELRRFQAGVENQFVGFGFRLRMHNGILTIRDIVPDSPAAGSELRKGDQILAVDGISLRGKSFEEAYVLLKGEEGSEAVLTVYSPDQKREKQIRLKRAYLSIPEVEGEPFDRDHIGYISLETFGSEAAYQMRDKLAQFSQGGKPLKGLILDLRDNGGGYLSTARDIASLFMEEGLLMYTTNRNGVELETWVRNGRDVSFPVRILVNQGTASASELLAGALRDHGIAKLIGTKTFGKGSAQQIIPLIDGDTLKLTLHEYFTPKHTVVNHVGLQPDVTVEDDLAQVIAALQSLGVQSFELRESDGDTTVNGVVFPAVEPLLKQEQGGWMVRAAVLAQLLRDEAIGQKGYVPLAPYLKRHPNLLMRQVNGELILSLQNQ